jgi:hypothetical protein
LPPVGTAEGAVYTVVAPLKVWGGLNVPQFVLLQLAFQSTP